MQVQPTTGGGFARWARRAALGAVLIVALVVGGTAFRVWQVGRVDNRTPADAIVVLGAAQYNGEPSAAFEARLAHAKRLYDNGVAKTVITGGGGLAGDAYTEAEAGALWLAEHGVPQASTVPVAEGRDTLGTLRAVAGVARDRGWQTAVVVSDPWHSLRARRMAVDAGLDAWVSPTHQGPMVQTRQTQLRYIVRETGALLYYRLTKSSADQIGGTGLS